jgi:hypothetical protein
VVSETPERVHKGCPTCTCEEVRERTIVYPPNLILYGSCGGADGCGKVKWQSETWTRRNGSWTPTRKTHCGCCREGCHGHTRENR